MAKSRKSNKTTDKSDQSAEAPENLEKIISPETEIATELEVPEGAVEPLADSLKEPEVLSDQVLETEAVAQQTDDVLDVTAEDVPEDVKDADLAPDADVAALDSSDPVDQDAADPKTDESAETEIAGETSERTEDILAEELGDEAENKSALDGQDDSLDEPEPDVKAQPEPKPQPQAPVQSSGMWPAVFGGVIAAMIGFIAGRGDMIDQFLPASMQRASVDVSALETQAVALAARATDIETQMTATTAAQEARIAALEVVSPAEVLDSVAGLEADIEVIATRIAALEDRPVAEAIDPGAPVEAVEELQAALDAQNAQIAALAARAEEAEANAAGEAARILARAALTRVVTAVDSGETFAPALTDLEDVTPVEVPTALRAAAESGVPTLAELQSGFPDAARAGLAAARAEVPEGEVAGITGFLKRQLNARSVTPREGDDPDAVLSRVQAAVSGGDLATALTEMEALPEAARTAMNDWLVAAQARKTAQDAANALADSLNSN